MIYTGFFLKVFGENRPKTDSILSLGEEARTFNTTETTKVLGASGTTTYESLDFPNRGVKPNSVLENLAAYGIDGTIG